MPVDNQVHRDCAVCLETMGVESHQILDNANKYGVTPDGHHVRLSCGHAFCKECTNNLLQNGSSYCPTCRTKISDREIKRLNQQMGTNHQFRDAHELRPEPASAADSRQDRDNELLWRFDLNHHDREQGRPPRREEPVPLYTLQPSAPFEQRYQQRHGSQDYLLENMFNDLFAQLLFADIFEGSAAADNYTPANDYTSANSAHATDYAPANNTRTQQHGTCRHSSCDHGSCDHGPHNHGSTSGHNSVSNQGANDDYYLYTIPYYQQDDGYFSTGSPYQQPFYDDDLWLADSPWQDWYIPQTSTQPDYGFLSQEPSGYGAYVDPFDYMALALLGLAF